MTISPEVIAAIIGSVATGLIGLGVYLYTSHRGNKVYFEKVNESSLIELEKSFSSNIEIKLKGSSVEKLILYEFELYNSSDNNISDLKVNIEFISKEDKFYVEQITKDLQDTTIVEKTLSNNFNTMLEIRRPYLKSKKKYKNEVIYIQIISSARIQFLVTGGGANWDTEYKEKSNNMKVFYTGLSLLGLVSLMGLWGIISPSIGDSIKVISFILLAIIGFSLGVIRWQR